ncbi:MAG: helix-turn-helix domain-containing protein [Candidatus Binatus sp.]
MAIKVNPHKGIHGEAPSVERLAFSMLESAAALGLSPGKIRLMLQSGELRSVHAGRRRLVPRQELEKFLSVSNEGD